MSRADPGWAPTIHLHLPAAARPAFAAAEDATSPSAVLPVWSTGSAESEPARGQHDRAAARVVLVAEDEDVVRELVVRILRNDGHVVHAAASGAEALGLLERLDRPVDVLLTDMVMPGMGGRELAERVLRQRPDTPVVFMSGYTEEAPALDGDQRPLDLPDQALLVDRAARRPQATRRSRPPPRAIAAPADATPLSCLIVDDHPTVLDAVSRHLESAGIRVSGASHGPTSRCAGSRPSDPPPRSSMSRSSRSTASSSRGWPPWLTPHEHRPLHRKPRPGAPAPSRSTPGCAASSSRTRR